MAQVTHSGSASFLGHEFDDFLFAQIDADRNGKLLSVLSALARLNIDPRQEAAKLARMPSASAIERLTSLIAALPEPDASLAHRDPSAIAIRLTALLPPGVNPNIALDETLFKTAPTKSQVGIDSRFVMYVVLIFTAFMLGAQFVKESRHGPTQIDFGHAPVSGEGPPQVPAAAPAS